MTQNNKELLPCPFCGSAATQGETEGCDHHVSCTSPFCGITILDDMLWGEESYNAKENVTKKWNTRADLSPAPKAVDICPICNDDISKCGAKRIDTPTPPNAALEDLGTTIYSSEWDDNRTPEQKTLDAINRAKGKHIRPEKSEYVTLRHFLNQDDIDLIEASLRNTETKG